MNNSSMLAALLLFMIVIILFVVSAVSMPNNSANITNSTNSINQILPNAPVNTFFCSVLDSVSITVNPTNVNLGNIDANGVEHTFIGVTTVHVRAMGCSGDFFVRALDNFVNTDKSSKIIPLSNFKFGCPGYIIKRPFTTSNQVISHYSYIIRYDKDYTMNYYLRVPLYTDPGVYFTTIIYTAT